MLTYGTVHWQHIGNTIAHVMYKTTIQMIQETLLVLYFYFVLYHKKKKYEGKKNFCLIGENWEFISSKTCTW